MRYLGLTEDIDVLLYGAVVPYNRE